MNPTYAPPILACAILVTLIVGAYLIQWRNRPNNADRQLHNTPHGATVVFGCDQKPMLCCLCGNKNIVIYAHARAIFCGTLEFDDGASYQLDLLDDVRCPDCGDHIKHAVIGSHHYLPRCSDVVRVFSQRNPF